VFKGADCKLRKLSIGRPQSLLVMLCDCNIETPPF
jgi:hypothetical protein